MEEIDTDSAARFATLKSQQPQPGDILSTVDGSPVRMTQASRTEGGRPKVAVFCRAFVDIDREGWFLEGGKRGIICLILPQSQKRLQRDDEGDLYAEKLKIVRYTDNGRSILCDLA
tara:strand:+ start:1036 stop:1383 length:348 start_codon:yes stop_codon:yes gene_type:complete